MIVLMMKDGLGNQFFEYGFARLLQKYTGEDIIINNYLYSHGFTRNYSLDHFVLCEHISVADNKQQSKLFVSFILRMLFADPIMFFKWVFTKKRPVTDKSFEKLSRKGLYVTFNTFRSFDIKISKNKTKFIYGNFENYSYIQPIIGELKKELSIKLAPAEKNANMINQVSSCNSVCVHIRRGDYLDPKWSWMNVCNFDYYQAGMDYIDSVVDDPVYYVFSNTHDDLKWIKENFHFKQQVKYVDLNNSDYQELQVMQNCKHFIISNSTYSWWAAVLAEAPDKVVVAPQTWSRQDDPADYQGMFLDDWYTIDVK